jgi:hypothetical protein
LLDESNPPVPTLLVDEWLDWTLLHQLAHLSAAWANASALSSVRQLRQQILQDIQDGSVLNARQKNQLAGLQILGLLDGESLTDLGRQVLAYKADTDYKKVHELWCFKDNTLIVPFPPDWKLLWEVEKYLDPVSPGVYPLNQQSIRLAVQRGATDETSSLFEILKQGLGFALPDQYLDAFRQAASIRLMPGVVLECSDSSELKELRKSKTLRKDLKHVLSARHVLLDPLHASLVSERLFRRGFVSRKELHCLDWLQSEKRNGTTTFSLAERAYLTVLLLIAKDIENLKASPPGLLMKMVTGMDASLIASSVHCAESVIKSLKPPAEIEVENRFPPDPSEMLLMKIQSAIDRQESIDILYQATGRHQPESRHISPLILEQRGYRHYLIAYCHLRRANRTFRIDRIKWIEP